MIYSLGITIVAGILIFVFLGAVAMLARKVAHGEGLGTVRGWRWYPSPLALFVLVPILAILLVRAAPLLFVLPLVVPIAWRNRWLAGPLMIVWNLGRKGLRDDDDGTVEGQYRPYRDT